MPPHPPSDPEVSDGEIVQLLRAHNPRGLTLLLRVHGPRVKRRLRVELAGMLSAPDLEEALYDAADHVWRGIQTFDERRGTLRGWFYAIAHHAGVAILRHDVLRRLGRAYDVDLAQVSSDGRHGIGSVSMGGGPGRSDDFGVSPAKALLYSALQDCISCLPPHQREIIQADLRSGDVADARELAQFLHTTPNSIYVTRFNARKKLKQCLQKRGFFADEAFEGQNDGPAEESAS
ncbi:MAG: sigma-70 family RNA polymerase sigma factor [Planctomycetes bacterium]|nr:sigma-70 family RNA polymerase sigma factor [Planctomycetota bacterium]